MDSKSHFILKRNLYENCRVRAITGEVIFYCSSRRAQWYLNRNLATVITQDPLEIQLTFETKGMGNAGDKFYLQHRKNLCVVCGTGEGLTRHHVVPFCYRKHLPDDIKDHSFHDILLLCITCHDNYERHAHQLKIKLGQEYGVPIDGVSDKEGHDKYKARGYAYALIRHSEEIPVERQVAMLQYIVDVMGSDDIESISKTYPELNGKTQGELIVARLTDLNAFLRLWRKHFVETMNPKFLPEHWSVERGTR